MKCSAIITIPFDSAILSGFKPEDKEIGERARYSLARKGKHIIFAIYADDAVALRAAFNSVTKMLAIAEKIRDV